MAGGGPGAAAVVSGKGISCLLQYFLSWSGVGGQLLSSSCHHLAVVRGWWSAIIIILSSSCCGQGLVVSCAHVL